MTSFGLPEPDERILELIGRLYYLTNEQIRMRYYGDDLGYVQGRTRGLAKANYLLPLVAPQSREKARDPETGRIKRGGSRPLAYTLTSQGLGYLHGLGIEPSRRWKESEQKKRQETEIEHSPTRHTLVLNDILIAVERLCDRKPDFQLVGYLHELDIKRMHLPAEPDAWINLHITEESGKSFRHSYLLELDMGNEKQTAIREKVDRLNRFVLSGGYQQAFGVQELDRIIWIEHRPERTSTLQEWIQAENARFGELAVPFEVIDYEVAVDPDWLADTLYE